MLDFLKGRSIGCPECNNLRVISFNWEMTKDGRLPEYRKYLKSIVFERKLKEGFLYRCVSCNRKWYLNENEHHINLVPKAIESTLNQWSQMQYKLDRSIAAKLLDIGATELGTTLMFPCKCTLNNGTVIDKCIIKLDDFPTLYDGYKQILFINDISEVLPSDFSLNLDIRQHTTQADEIAMGFAPTLIRAADGNRFIVNNVTNFFDFNGYKGNEMQLEKHDTNLARLSVPIYNEKDSDITLILGDYKSNNEWFYS